MKPYVICHMISTIDGKTDAAAARLLWSEEENDAIYEGFRAQGWICGKTTMREFAEAGEFDHRGGVAVAAPQVHVARRADSYAVGIDNEGVLLWGGGEVEGDHLVCVLSERVSDRYLSMLRERGISYIVNGKERVDLRQAVEALSQHFGVSRIVLQGGGHINGGFFEAGLVDEISLLLIPGVDGRSGIAGVFDGLGSERRPEALKLIGIERRQNDTLWLRYSMNTTSAVGDTQGERYDETV